MFKRMVSKDNQQRPNLIKAGHVNLAKIAIKIEQTNVLLDMIKVIPVKHPDRGGRLLASAIVLIRTIIVSKYTVIISTTSPI